MGAFDTIVAATVQVDTTTANANVVDLNKNLGTTKTALADVGGTAKTTTTAVTETGGSFGKLKDQISAVPGPIGNATDGVNKLSAAFKAMLANPVVLVITAIVGALAFLYKAFTNSFEGGEKMEQVFAGIKAAASVLLDSILDIGSAIIKLFSGDFKGAFQDAKDAVNGVVHGVVDAYNQVSGLTKQMQDLHKQQLVADLATAQRQAQIAQLRDQASDETVPIAKRKAALTELKTLSEKAAADDIALAKKTRDTKIALDLVGKDAAKKNMDDIAKANIDFENKKTQTAQEARAIDRQVKQVDQQQRAADKAAAAAIRDKEKKDREQNQAFQEQLLKLQHQNALAGIVDQYTKEKQALENKLSDEAALLKKDFDNKKLTRDQYNQLNIAQQQSAQIQRDALTKKHQEDIKDKEEAFQADLAQVIAKTQVDSITNQRAAAKAQLEITYQQALINAKKNYGDNAVQFQTYKNALDAQLKAQQDALDEKNRVADEKKKLADAKKHTSTVLSDPKSAYKARQAAINAEQAQVKKAFDDKALTESEYNDEVEQLAAARIKIKQEEEKQISTISGAIGDAFNTLADIAGKQTAVGKALAIAGTTVKTFQAGFDAFSGMVSEIPGPVGIVLGIVAAAGALAAGIAAVKNIVAVQVPGQASSGSVPSAPALPTAPVMPAQRSTSINTASVNAVGSAVSGRSYVLDADVANNRDRDARLSRAARLGG